MLKRFLLWGLVCWILLGLALGAGKLVYDSSLKRQTLQQHQHLLRAAKTMLNEHLMMAVQDTQQLSAVAFELGYLDTPGLNSEQQLIQILLSSTAIYGRYDQIRILDLEGRERIRINNSRLGPVVVPQHRLQNKRGRYYVQQGLKLKPGQVYLSPLDLSKEQGKLETPFKPTLRLVRMMKTATGEPAGLLVLNLNAAGLLNQFIELFPSGDRAMLLNADGYWLVNHDPANEWGWMRNKPELTLARWQPALWQQLQTSRSGSAYLDDSLFSFHWLDIASIYENTTGARYGYDLGLVSDLKASQWAMLIESDQQRWQVTAIYHKTWFQIALVGAFLVTLLTVYLLLRNRQQTREKAQLEREQLDNFRDLYENAPIGYITLTRDGYISNVNKRTLDYLGYRREELINKIRLAELVEADTLQLAETLLLAMMESEEEHRRIRVRAKNGDILVMSCGVSSRLSHERTLELGRLSMQNVSQQARLEQQLKDMARKDPLTGAANRRRFDELAERELARSQRNGAPLTLIELDIDHFKQVNDTYGHDAGDEVLKVLAELCMRSLRATDVLARFGGEEFVILLPDTSLEQGVHKAEQLREALSRLRVMLADNTEIRFTVSLGVSTLSPVHNSIQAMFKAADSALYKAKNTGRNKVCAAASPGEKGNFEI
ncbi:diguanylate cyclase [Oceanimonas sp. CAM02]|uniref:sensor domain-containing diguanylate cyclase n=1 Tax=Oceanimonas sp. CAM02 TaxID=3080336 RepID=UPI0029361130|nr:diguanylate cyclase [Oceanimonas sp. CAM02]MDV2856300.1 diguanylate cyclase [Oceanimonas sp. CAM02]